jgi:hypothetical protein
MDSTKIAMTREEAQRELRGLIAELRNMGYLYESSAAKYREAIAALSEEPLARGWAAQYHETGVWMVWESTEDSIPWQSPSLKRAKARRVLIFADDDPPQEHVAD